jgi:ABC-type transport system involved in cytochrome c biogenesis permease subunit
MTSTLLLVLYSAAAISYVVFFTRRSPSAGRASTLLLSAAVLTHTFVIGMHTMEVGYAPFVGQSAAISTFVWLLALAYLYTEFSTEERSMGTFIVPLLAILQIIPTINPRLVERPPELQSPLLAFHVTSLLFAYASFALACVIGITYVLLFKEIKAKHLGYFYARLPSLQVLDVMNVRAITIGWIFLTIGVAVGILWARRVAGAADDPRLQAMTLFDPKIFVALICWVVYSFEMFATRAIGWRGRRTAWLSTLGFAIVLLNFLPVSYFLTRSHNF